MTMKKVLLVILALNITLLAFCSKPVVQTAEQEQEVKNVINDFYKSFDLKDIPALMTFFRDDFMWYTANGMILTNNKFAAFFSPIFENWKYVTTEVNVFDIRIEGTMAVARFSTKMQTDIKTTSIKNLHTMVLIYQFGEWKMWHHQESMQ